MSMDPDVQVPGYELWMTFIKHVHIIPFLLDVEIFRHALLPLANAYPHTVGRLMNDSGNWKIKLDSSLPTKNIPVEVHSSHRIAIHGWVVQDHNILEPLLCQTSNNVNKFTPLLRIKLTLATEEAKTAIGISWHHTLGDATVLLHFMHTLSQHYQGLESSYPVPNFVKHAFPDPSCDSITKYSHVMPHISHSLRPSGIEAHYAAMNRTTARIDWRISVSQAEMLRDKIRQSTQVENVSLQDCLTSYIVTLLNRCSPLSIRTVTNAASYRGIYTPSIDVAGNSIIIIPTDTLGESESNDIVAIAQTIRRSIRKYREPHVLEDWMSVASHLMLLAANEGKSIIFGIEPEVLSVNSNLKFDWNSVHFGAPELSNFYTSGISKHYLRAFRSNPTAENLAFRAIELSFGVPAELKSAIVRMMESDFGSAEFPNNITTT